MTYTQVNERDHVPIQSVSIDLVQDSPEYIESTFDRLEKLMNELSPRAFCGGYQMQIVVAS
jgi:hypothetical protein